MTGRNHGEDGTVQLPQAIPVVIIKSGQSPILSSETDFAPALKILVVAPFGNSPETGMWCRLVWSGILATPPPLFLSLFLIQVHSDRAPGQEHGMEYGQDL